MSRWRTPEEDDARADDFRCRGCEAPLDRPAGGQRFCWRCREEEGGEA